MPVNMGNAVGYLDLDISAFTAALAEAQQQANTVSKTISKSFDNAQKEISKIADTIGKVGKTMTVGITAPITAGFGASIKVLSEFEATMSRVEALSGATGEELDALSEKAQEMGATTKYSANDAAEAFTYMAQAGWNTASMLDGIDGVMNLAASDGIALADASNIVTSSLTAFGLEAKDAAHFADVLAVASAASNTDVASLGEAFKYVAPLAGTLGLSIEDVSTALGIMSNNGIVASQAGTTLRSMLSRLAAPTAESKKYMDELGISIANNDGTMKSLDQVIRELRSAFSGLTEAQKAQYATEIFGQEAQAGTLALINSSVDSYDDLKTAIYDSDGAAQQMAATMQDNLKGQMEELSSAVESIAMNVGQVLLPYVKEFVAWLQSWAEKLAGLNEEQTELVVKIAAVAAIIGPATIAVSKLVSGFSGLLGAIGKVTSGFSILSSATAAISAPILAVVGVIATLAAAFATLWNTSETFRVSIINTWNKFKETVMGVIGDITEGLNMLGINWSTILYALKAVWDGFCQALAPVFTTAFSVILEVLGTILETIGNVFSVFANLFSGNWEGLWNSIGKFFYDIVSGIYNAAKSIFSGIITVWNNFIGPFQDGWETAWNSISSFFTDLMNGILDGFSSVVNWVLDAVGTLAGGVGAFLDFLGIDAGTRLMEWADKVKNTEVDLVDSTEQFLERTGQVVQSGMSAVDDFFNQGWDNVVNNTQLEDISSAVDAEMDGVVESVEDATDKVADSVSGPLAEVPQVVAKTLGMSAEEVEAELADIGDAGTNVLNNLVSTLSQIEEMQTELGASFDATALEMQAYTAAIDSLKALGLDEESEIILNLSATLETLGNSFEHTAGSAGAAAAETQTSMESLRAQFDSQLASINANADAMAELGLEYDKDAELTQLYQTFINRLLALPVSERTEEWTQYMSYLNDELANLNVTVEETDIQALMNDLESSVATIEANAEAMATLGESYDVTTQLTMVYQGALNQLLDTPVEERTSEWTAAFEEVSDKLAELNSAPNQEGNFFDNWKERQDEFKENFGKDMNDVIDIYNTSMGYISDIGTAVYDLFNTQWENQLNQIDAQINQINEMYDAQLEAEKKRNDQALADLKLQYQNKEITAEQYAAAKNALEQQMTNFENQQNEERAAKELELKRQADEIARKQFEAQKATKIAQVWIDAASATIRAFAENWWPIAIGYAAAIATMAGLQTAAIAKQQYVSAFAKGGIVNGPTLGLIGEDGREAIVPLERNTEWLDLVASRLQQGPGIGQGGYNITFNSPRAIDAREASRLMKRTVRDLAEGF